MGKEGKAKRMHTFVKAYDKYRVIEDDRDLAKNHLTLTEYYTVAEILKDLSGINNNKSVTLISGVASWFERNGFNVEMDEHNCNYVISI